MSDSAREIMQGFARRTGLSPEAAPSIRYLWTDAFAVCNWLGHFLEAGDRESLRLALRLVDETHRVLGRHRPDDLREGWISDLADEEGSLHPTIGGLRIGKTKPERPIGTPYDPALEWDRDGQYFHYLTKWMHALDCASRTTGNPTYRRWAFELAKSAYAHFLVSDASGMPIGLHWKMSIDLSRPLVPSMGQHDPLDGLITYGGLVCRDPSGGNGDLRREIRGLRAMCRGRSWVTDDVLGIGGLLTDAYALARSELNADSDAMAGASNESEERLREIIESSLVGLEAVVRARQLDAPVERRLAFRELGLSIGLRAAFRLRVRIEESGVHDLPRGDAIRPLLDALAQYEPLAARIESFWLEPANRRAGNWNDHRDINDVMLATSLAPHGYLEL